MRREFKSKTKVLLIDDNYDHLAGVSELVSSEGMFNVVGTSTNATMGMSLIKKYHPDVVIMDMNMPEKNGLEAIQEIEKMNLGVRVLVLSGYDDSDLIFRAMKLGAKGYVLKTMASAQLIYALEEVADGKVYLPSSLTSRFFEYFQQQVIEEKTETVQEDNYLSFLTAREEEVLDLLSNQK